MKPGFGAISANQDRAPAHGSGSIDEAGALVMRRIVFIVWALGSSAILHGCAHGTTEERWRSTDEKWLSAMNAGQGLVVMDATISATSLISSSPRECGSVDIVLGSNVDGKVRNKRLIAETHNIIEQGAVLHLISPMDSGEYTVLAVECGRSRFNGPHAKFQVRAGEFVNVGGLKMENQPGGGVLNIKMRRSVVEVRPEILAYVRERVPRSMAKMVNRPMTIVGPPEIILH